MSLLELTEQLIDAFYAACPRTPPAPHDAAAARIIAHRGAHDNAQGVIENTLAAFDLAKDAGCWGIEFDVHATADHVLVVNHDPTLKRLWGHDAVIAELSFAELRALEPGVPSLAEVISRYQGMHLFIELKSPFNDEEVLAKDLCGLAPGTDFHLLSLDASLFAAMTQFPRQSLLLVAVHNNVRAFCDLSIKEQYGGVMGSYVLFTNSKIKQLHGAKQLTGVGFVNSKYSLYRELNRGIHWFFTNKAVDVCGALRGLLS